MGIRLLALVMAGFVFLLVLELVRRERLSFKYALAWFLISFAGAGAAVFHKQVFFLSRLCGFEVPSNFIFFVMLGAFVFLSLLLTVFLCQQNRRNDRMAQQIGMLGLEIARLRKILEERNS